MTRYDDFRKEYAQSNISLTRKGFALIEKYFLDYESELAHYRKRDAEAQQALIRLIDERRQDG